MANWKKVVVSGSSPEFLNVTSSGNVSASGKLYGGLDINTDQTYVVVYNPITGELEYKELNLVNVQRSPELFMIDIEDSDKSSNVARLSFDSGSVTIPTNAPYKFSASLDGGATFPITSSLLDSGAGQDAFLINNVWFIEEVDDSVYFDPNNTINETQSYSEGNTSGPKDANNGIYYGTNRQDIVLTLQSHGTITDYTAVPAFTPGPAYVNRAFDSPIQGDTGSIQVYLNNTETPVAEFSLTASGNPAITTEIANIIPDISPSGSALDTDGITVDETKTFRSGSITIEAEAQQDGYNFAYLFYTGSRNGGVTQIRALTNFTSWFYDQDGAGQNLSTVQQGNITDLSFNETSAGTTESISGIKFFTSTAATNTEIIYRSRIENYYKNIYPQSDGIRFEGLTTDTIDSIELEKNGDYVNSATQTKTGVNIVEPTQFTRPTLQDVNLSYTSDLRTTASIGIDFGSIEFHQPTDFTDVHQKNSNTTSGFDTEADVTFRIQYDHISGHKTNSSRQGNTITRKDWLLNQLSDTSNEHEIETFRRETYRITSQSGYTNTTQANIDANTGSILDNTYAWDSEKNVVSSDSAHEKGLTYYYSALYDPRFAGDGSANPFSTTYGPTGQPTNYDTATGEREYYRYFKLQSNQGGSNALTFEIFGEGKIVREAQSTDFTTGDEGVKMYIWRSKGGGSSAINGQFLNVLDASIRNNVGNGVTNDSRYIEIPNTTSGINFSETAQTLDGLGFPIGAVKIEDTNGNTFSQDEVIIVKFIVPQQWSGRVGGLLVRKGAVGSGSPYMGDSTNSGVDGNENYGTSNL